MIDLDVFSPNDNRAVRLHMPAHDYRGLSPACMSCAGVTIRGDDNIGNSRKVNPLLTSSLTGGGFRIPAFFSFRHLTFPSLTISGRNRMNGCAKRQAHEESRISQVMGNSFSASGAGRVRYHRSPTNKLPVGNNPNWLGRVVSAVSSALPLPKQRR